MPPRDFAFWAKSQQGQLLVKFRIHVIDHSSVHSLESCQMLGVIRPKRAKILPQKAAKFYRRLYVRRLKLAFLPHHTTVCKLLSKLATLLILGCSFQSCWRIFANWSQSEEELKEPWKGPIMLKRMFYISAHSFSHSMITLVKVSTSNNRHIMVFMIMLNDYL